MKNLGYGAVPPIERVLYRSSFKKSLGRLFEKVVVATAFGNCAFSLREPTAFGTKVGGNDGEIKGNSAISLYT